MTPDDNTPQTPVCLDCGAELQGRFCSCCGQKASSRDLRLKHVLAEVVHDVTHFDARFFRTLRLLFFSPGRLTQEYLLGRRTRHVPPFRLYIFVSFLLFLVLGVATRSTASKLEGKEVKPGVLNLKSEDGRANMILNLGGDTEEGEATRSAASPELEHDIQKAAKTAAKKAAQKAVGSADGQEFEQNIQKAAQSSANKEMERNIRKAITDPDAFREHFLHWLSRVMFVLLPAFATLLLLVFMGARRYFVEHVIFSLHFHSFAFSLFIAQALLTLIPWGPAGTLAGWLTLALPLHLGFALKRVYGGATWKILVKGAILSFLYLIMVGLAMLGVVLWVLRHG